MVDVGYPKGALFSMAGLIHQHAEGISICKHVQPLINIVCVCVLQSTRMGMM